MFWGKIFTRGLASCLSLNTTAIATWIRAHGFGYCRVANSHRGPEIGYARLGAGLQSNHTELVANQGRHNSPTIYAGPP